MKLCAAILSVLLIADAALTLLATESAGLLVAVVSWLLLYPLLGKAIPRWSHGARWALFFAGLAIGYGIDHITNRSFHWFTAVAAVAAAGHYAGWAGAVDLLLGKSAARQLPAPLGRPGCFNTSFAASLLLAYLCQTTAGGLDTRIGLIAGFVAVALGFTTWELGRSVKGRRAGTGRRVAPITRLLHWLLASAAGLAAFFIFAQVLPLAAEQATRAMSFQVSGDSFDLPDIPDFDDPRFNDSRRPAARRKLPGAETQSGREPETSMEGLPGGFTQDVAGNAPENVQRQQEFNGGQATSGQSGNVIAPANDPVQSSPTPSTSTDSSLSPGLESPNTTTAFWNLPPALVWPFLLLVVLIGIAAMLVILFLRSRGGSESGAGHSNMPRRSSWDNDHIPSYLHGFFARAAELGFEKERGDTLREFLRLLRRRGRSHDEFPRLRDYHYKVQFEDAPRNNSRESGFRRNARKWLR